MSTPICQTDRAAVIDLGSNSFRMVVFRATGDRWERELELSHGVRLGEGMLESGRLSKRAMRRGLDAVGEFARACESLNLGPECMDAVATSAVRDAENGREFLEYVCEQTGLAVRVLSREQEARYAYLAAVNSTTLTDGCVLDLGGGSLQLVHVAGRLARETGSWRLGAVRMTERFLSHDGPAQPQVMEALRSHASRKLSRAGWLERAAEDGRLVGLGGTVRNLAAAAQRACGLAERVHGYTIRAGTLGDLIERLASLPADRRADVPGIKAARADIVLAGAVVIQSVMHAGGFDALEVTGAGLREGVFFERQLDRRQMDGLPTLPSSQAA